MAQERVASNEQWRDIPGYEGWYQVSDMGRVKRVRGGRGTKSGKILSGATDTGGYWHVVLFRYPSRKQLRIHRLVMAAFVGPCPDGYEVNHLDGDKANNRLDNLEYCTPSENSRHAIDVLGVRRVFGEASGTAKLTEEKVREIKSFLSTGITQEEIALMFNTSQQTISDISLGRRWSHVS